MSNFKTNFDSNNKVISKSPRGSFNKNLKISPEITKDVVNSPKSTLNININYRNKLDSGSQNELKKNEGNFCKNGKFESNFVQCGNEKEIIKEDRKKSVDFYEVMINKIIFLKKNSTSEIEEKKKISIKYPCRLNSIEIANKEEFIKIDSMSNFNENINNINNEESIFQDDSLFKKNIINQSKNNINFSISNRDSLQFTPDNKEIESNFFILKFKKLFIKVSL